MSVSVKKSPREKRIQWLMDHFDLWEEGYPYNVDSVSNYLVVLMKKKGLYAMNSRNLKIKDLLKIAKYRLER